MSRRGTGPVPRALGHVGPPLPHDPRGGAARRRPGHARLPAHRARRGHPASPLAWRAGALAPRPRALAVGRALRVRPLRRAVAPHVDRRAAPDELGDRHARRDGAARRGGRRAAHAPRGALRPRAASRGSRSALLGVGLLVGFDVGGSNWVWIAAMGVVVHRLRDRPGHHLAAPRRAAGRRRRRLRGHGRRARLRPLRRDAPARRTSTWSVVGAIAGPRPRLHGRRRSSSCSSSSARSGRRAWSSSPTSTRPSRSSSASRSSASR